MSRRKHLMPTKKSDVDKEKGLELDFDAFEQQIDDEIDRLFVPFSAPIEEPPAVIAKTEEPRLVMDEVIPPPALAPASAPAPAAPAAPAPAIDLFFKEPAPMPVAAQPPKEKISDELPARMPPIVLTVEEPIKLEIKPPTPTVPSELINSLDSLSVAYLSLDWEFSTENVVRMDSALGKLTSYCQQVPESQSLFKILKVILSQVGGEPASVSPRVLELIRDSQELLRDILLTGSGLDSRLRQRFNDLVARVRTVRNEGLLGKKAPSEPAAAKKPVVELEQEKAPRDIVPLERVAGLDWAPLREFREWMEFSGSQSSDAAQRLQEEGRRLQQIEQVLGKTPVLAPIVSRLSNVRSGLDGCSLSLKESGQEWEKRLNWLIAFEKNIEESLAKAPAQAKAETAASPPAGVSVSPIPSPVSVAPEVAPVSAAPEVAPASVAPEVAPVPGTTPITALAAVTSDATPVPEQPTEALPPKEEPEGPETAVRQEEVYSYRLLGKRFAVASSLVVRIGLASPRKVNKIRERGYAVLADFKPFLRSLKSGLNGTWSDLPVDVLKTYQFFPLPLIVPGTSDVDLISGTVILVSNGEKHGIIFAEPDGVRLSVESVTSVSDEKGILGVIHSETDPPIEVLNMDEILRSLDEPNTGDI
jgi:hypothetical protein